MVTKPAEGSISKDEPNEPNEPIVVLSSGSLFPTSDEALKAVREDDLYWTGKLTETSLQLSYAVIAANWAVFGSVDKLMGNRWAKISVVLVVIGLALSVAGAKWMGELHRGRIDHAETDRARWNVEFKLTAGKRDPWPFTAGIERLGRGMREAKTWLPLAAGVSFLMALVLR